MPAGSVVNGVIAATQTYQTGDIINGNTAGALSNVNVTIAAGGAAGALVDINNIETVTFRTLAAQNIDAQLFTNVGTVANSGGNAVLTVNNGAIASTYLVSNSIASSPVEGMTVNLRAGDITGAANTINFAVSGAGSTDGTTTFRSALVSGSTGVEGIAVDTTGTNYISVQGSVAATTDSKTLTLTGDGTNSVQIAAGALATTSKIDGSALTGNLTLDVTSNVTSNDTITGGEGTADVLQMLTGGAATGVRVSGFETLRVAEGSVGTILFGGTAPNFETIQVAGAAAATTNATFGSVGAPTTIYYRGNGSSTTANLAALESFGNLTLNSSFTGSSDTVAVNINNRGVAKNAGVGVTVGNLAASGVEALNYTVADITSTGLTTLGTITSNTLQSASFVTPGALTVGVITGGATGTISALDFSGVVGNLTAAAGVAAGSLTDGAVITFGGASTVTNNFVLANDQTNATSLNFVGAAGADTIDVSILSAASAAIQGGGGADILTGGGGADIIEGGNGGDRIVGNAGNDTLTGGEGADTITGGGGNDSINLAEVTSLADQVVFAASAAANGTDTITGFIAGTDTLNVAAFETAGALVAGTGAYTITNGQVVILGGQAAGAADSAAAAITALNAAGTVTAATATNWVVISDDNSTAIYSAAQLAANTEYTGATLTLVASIDAAMTQAQLAAGVLIV